MFLNNMNKQILLEIERLATVGTIKIFRGWFLFLLLPSFRRTFHVIEKSLQEITVIWQSRPFIDIDLRFQLYMIQSIFFQFQFLRTGLAFLFLQFIDNKTNRPSVTTLDTPLT